MALLGKKHVQAGVQEDVLDNWLITYADMITLLLCFFAIFLAMSSPKSKTSMEDVTEEIRGQFGRRENIKLEMGDKIDMAGNAVKQSLFTQMNSIVALYPLQKDIMMEETEKGVIMELGSGSFYESGTAELTEQGKAVLKEMAAMVGNSRYYDYNITVEGHTDDSPIRSPKYPSNWELSANRATNVVRLFIDEGIDAKRLRASGYADIFPKLPNRDNLGMPLPDNQAVNRRVTIKIERDVEPPAMIE